MWGVEWTLVTPSDLQLETFAEFTGTKEENKLIETCGCNLRRFLLNGPQQHTQQQKEMRPRCRLLEGFFFRKLRTVLLFLLLMDIIWGEH